MTAKVWITYGPRHEYAQFQGFVDSVRQAGKFVATMQGFDPTLDADSLINSEDHGYVEMYAEVADDRLSDVLTTLSSHGLNGLVVDYTSEAQADLIEQLGFQCGDDLSEEN